MSTSITRDKQPKGNGKAPAFQIRINPELKEQLEAAAAKDGTSLGNWFKELARKELKRQGIEPKG
ncbi:MAG: toxin-antitoxin system HicB family antitoxin [Pantoea sp. Morm]|jgi:predicted HicB family RNase H-like nuclease|uniref:toxin-antitoxin system HicB family antitoxin n=1 Tax=Pantoea TaxID=53335 RepID=UPI0013318D87|nr:toxin-antitoxin system HicB family antitoxin [Pantoea dispersa]MBK4772195.1 toxin-antitoxin system HicB family antitoxin [Pantoea sp. Morm]UKY35577.1 toxin-antitoxin system HicB family antitoxin [Pantoea dispersa]WEA04814.1 toxin-antitoxin system HicB family antitoxin [Pantoea dispersa]